MLEGIKIFGKIKSNSKTINIATTKKDLFAIKVYVNTAKIIKSINKLKTIVIINKKKSKKLFDLILF